MTFRSDLDALSARHDALEAEAAAKAKERDAARQLLEEAKQRAKLPVLDNIRVASPCPADWNQMTGDDRVRACAACNKNVYNLSQMTRDEAEALIVAKEGRLCVRYYQRIDGTIMLADCTIGAKRRRRRKWIAAGAAALLAGTGGFLVLRKHHEAPVQGTVSLGYKFSEGRNVAGGMEAPPVEARQYGSQLGHVDGRPGHHPAPHKPQE